jgi:uncharacterized cupin superfamily protein
MSKQRSAIPAAEVPESTGSLYPEPFKSRMGDRRKRRLGDAFGLTQYGVNLVTLGPGAQSALRHWHTREDELVYIVAGELVLTTDAGEQVVRSGDVVGFPGGQNDGHHFVNRSDRPAQYIEIGSRLDDDMAYYPDDDLQWLVREDGEWTAAHKDGKPY